MKRDNSYNTEKEGISEVRIGATMNEDDESVKQKTDLMIDSGNQDDGDNQKKGMQTDLMKRGSVSKRRKESDKGNDSKRRHSVNGIISTGFGVEREHENRIII